VRPPGGAAAAARAGTNLAREPPRGAVTLTLGAQRNGTELVARRLAMLLLTVAR